MSSDLDALLDRALVDRDLSREERRALTERMADVEGRRQVQARAFALVARRLGPDAKSLLEFLDDVVTLAHEPTRSLLEVHQSPSDDAWQRIVELVVGAKRSIDVCVFTITDDRISSELFYAHQRGVHVRIVSDDDKSQEPGSDIRRLKERGLTVRLDQSEHHMHHKFALFDERTLLTGSYNWTRAAAEANQDNFLVTDEHRAVRGYQTIFERVWSGAR